MPSLEHQSTESTQITTSDKKQQGCSLLEMDGWRCKELFKGPMHKFSFVVTYPGFQQRKEQSVLETPEERLGTEALGRDHSLKMEKFRSLTDVYTYIHGR